MKVANRSALYQAQDSRSPVGSTNWAGVVQTSSVNRVHGTIVLPDVGGSGPSDAAVSAWVGIDGSSCSRALLQTGVDILPNGKYSPWAEWYPDNLIQFTTFALKAGDRIRMTIIADSASSGTAYLENLTTGQTVSRAFPQGPVSLCLSEADWILEEYDVHSQQVPLIDFGKFSFTEAAASGPGGFVTPEGGEIINLQTSSGYFKTDCAAYKGQVDCKAILAV